MTPHPHNIDPKQISVRDCNALSNSTAHHLGAYEIEEDNPKVVNKLNFLKRIIRLVQIL